MKLAIIRRRYTPYGGAERFIERIIPRLIERGIEPTILAEQWKTGVASTEQADARALNKSADGFLPIRVRGFTRTARFRSFQKAILETINNKAGSGCGFDLIQSHERIPGVDIFRLGDGVHAAWFDRLKRQSRGLGLVWLKMDPWHRAVIETEKQMALDPGIQYVANSRLVANELQDYWSVPDHRITLIPNGVDVQAFRPPSPRERAKAREAIAQQYAVRVTPETLIISFVGSGFRRKGVFELTQACAKYRKCILLVCGKDRDTNLVKTHFLRNNQENNIVLTGPLTDVRPVLHASDVFALPSLYDPASNAVLEALSCGLPVIVTRDVGMAWEISNRGAGIVCERSIAGLLEALRQCDDVQKRSSMAYQARAFAIAHDQDLIIDQWLELYRTLRAKR